ncbi:hypothetical protein GYMLUDRAFT_832391 [Collybiopsis luxurians FD-317 M1]|uniref:Uncharacterized protein n=1 Tax=Collybiopsis luxurians FD-317 M1 TaxID=944289 RepID=A0A0D0CCM6_9AGAR|nr:hypothetical protein GYMLUDRAFT_832391 [Collybiopsis luxurians FD-317 M1]
MPATPSPRLPPLSGRVASSPERLTTSTAAANVEVSTPGPSRSMPSFSTQVTSSSANNAKMQLSIASRKAVCSKLPKSVKKKVVRDLCTKVFGTASFQIFKHPEAVVKRPNSQDQLLITVSLNNNKLCSSLTKFDQWTGHILLQNTTAGHLYYLGQCGCGPTSKIDRKEYNSLPEETKKYILDSAKSIRHHDIKTTEHLISSMGAAHGIYVAKTELRFPSYNGTFKKGLREEARKRGYA